MMTYHAQKTCKRTARCVAIRRVHFGASDRVVLDMAAEDDLSQSLKRVVLQITVQK